MLKFVRNHRIAVGFLGLLLLLVFGANIATFYTDWLWYGEVGRRDVFLTIARTKALLLFGFGAASFVLAYLNLRLADRFAPPAGVRLPGDGPDNSGDVFIFDRMGRPQRVKTANGRAVNVLSSLRTLVGAALLLAALVFAFLSGLAASGQWDSFLRFTHPGSFGEKDPLFGHDIGYYVFALPFLRFVQGWLLVVLLVIGAAVASLYVFQRGIDTVSGGKTFVAPHVRAHLSGLAALALLVQAWRLWLDRYDLLQSYGPLFSGAGYADVHARLPLLNLLIGVTVIAAMAVAVNIRQRSIRLPLGALALWLVASLLGAVIPGIVQKTVVQPNEQARERPFIAHAIAATRAAYGLNAIGVRPFPAESTPPDLRRNQATIDNIRLWDYEPLLETYPQQQGLKDYYAFPDVDVDRYRLGGTTGYRQVWLAAREINPDPGMVSATTWTNRHLRYTHGYGVVMSPVNEFVREGLPTFFLRDIPVVSTVPGLDVPQPRIYFGQAAPAGSYVVVGTKQSEFDYPADTAGGGSAERETRYDGAGGVRLTPLARFAFALRFSDQNLMLSRDLTSDSRLLMVRSVADRVRRVAPFLRLDGDPYPVLSADRIVWVQDAFTTTDAYPYSRPFAGPGGENYLRNSVKATVDAYDGTVTLYASPDGDRDPILSTYRRIFPNLVQPFAAMPSALRAHLRYPEDLFRAQRMLLASYHVTDPDIFYVGNDAWDLAREQARVDSPDGGDVDATGARLVQPYYLIMRLPEERDEEFLLISPFTPRRKQNMSALLAARCDPADYGKLVLYTFPTSRNIYGPEQIASRIRQDSTISPQITLLNQQGSRVLFGNLIIVPIDKSLLYVQPLYLKAQAAAGGGGASIPELKKVIVAFEGRIAMASTLPEALNEVFGAPETPETTPTSAPGPATGRPADALSTLIERAGTQYERAQAALRSGDFAGYGRESKALGETLKALRARDTGGTRP